MKRDTMTGDDGSVYSRLKQFWVEVYVANGRATYGMPMAGYCPAWISGTLDASYRIRVIPKPRLTPKWE